MLSDRLFFEPHRHARHRARYLVFDLRSVVGVPVVAGEVGWKINVEVEAERPIHRVEREEGVCCPVLDSCSAFVLLQIDP